MEIYSTHLNSKNKEMISVCQTNRSFPCFFSCIVAIGIQV